MSHSSPTPAGTRRHAAPSRRRVARAKRTAGGRSVLVTTLTLLLTAVVLGLPVLSDAEETGQVDVATSSWWGGDREGRPGNERDGRKVTDRGEDQREERASRAASRARSSAVGSAAQTGGSAAAGTAAAPGTAAVPTTGAAPSTGNRSVPATAGGPFIPYSADSFFRSPLPAVTPVSADNARLVSFARSANQDPYLKIRGARGVGWGIAFAEADCSDPIYRIGSGKLPASQAHLGTVGFHAPASLWENIPPNADAPFLVVDRCGTSARPGGLSVWGAGTTVSGSEVNVTYAGSFSHDSNGLDRRNPLSDSQLNERSRGVIPDSMVIRLDALDYAIRSGTGLGYVLEVFWVETDTAAGFAHPMVGAESGKAGAGAEGQRFRIKPGIDLSSRPGCGPVGLAIARTLQQHGAYLGDNSGSGSGIKTEQNADFPGLTADSLQGCMTWDDIEFLPLGWQG